MPGQLLADWPRRRDDHNSPAALWNTGVSGEQFFSIEAADLLFPALPLHQLLHNPVAADILPKEPLVRVIQQMSAGIHNIIIGAKLIHVVIPKNPGQNVILLQVNSTAQYTKICTVIAEDRLA
ncbi:hypothetical protein D3C73_1055740 [compost metagenome]